jgi:hypothetical protein
MSFLSWKAHFEPFKIELSKEIFIISMILWCSKITLLFCYVLLSKGIFHHLLWLFLIPNMFWCYYHQHLKRFLIWTLPPTKFTYCNLPFIRFLLKKVNFYSSNQKLKKKNNWSIIKIEKKSNTNWWILIKVKINNRSSFVYLASNSNMSIISFFFNWMLIG